MEIFVYLVLQHFGFSSIIYMDWLGPNRWPLFVRLLGHARDKPGVQSQMRIIGEPQDHQMPNSVLTESMVTAYVASHIWLSGG